eukprot:scaffold390526_cov25-Prasinocladus_malaysianus.AAC.1
MGSSRCIAQMLMLRHTVPTRRTLLVLYSDARGWRRYSYSYYFERASNVRVRVRNLRGLTAQ